MTEAETLTTGMVGRQVRFRLSADWDGLQKTAVYMAGGEVRVSLNVGSVDTIPREVLEKPLERLYVGLYGVSGDGTRVIPTIRVQGPVIQPGAEPEGDPSADASLPVWAQILEMIGDIRTLETRDVSSLVAAINGMVRDNAELSREMAAAVAEYLEKNPVTPGASAEEADQIRQNTRDIRSLQEDKLGMDALSEGVNTALAQAKESGMFDGTGTVDSVAGISPDDAGNVALTPGDIGAVAVSDIIPVSSGGTGANTAAEALTNLGIAATGAELNALTGITSNVQTQLDGKVDQHTWYAHVAGKTWSRLCYSYANGACGCAFLLNVAATRSNVVYHDTYIIKTHHHYKAHIVKISGNNYTTGLGIRVVVGKNGECYVELYDDAADITSSTVHGVTCRLVNIYTGGVDLYGEFTDGTSLPAGYQVGASITTNANALQCSDINVLSSDYYGTELPAAGKAGRIFFKKVSG